MANVFRKYKVSGFETFTENSMTVDPLIENGYLVQCEVFKEKQIATLGDGDSLVAKLQHEYIKNTHDEDGKSQLVYYVNRTFQARADGYGTLSISLNTEGETFPAENPELFLVSRVVNDGEYGVYTAPEHIENDGVGVNSNSNVYLNSDFTRAYFEGLSGGDEYRVIATVKKEGSAVREKTKTLNTKTIFINKLSKCSKTEIQLGKADVVALLSVKQSSGEKFNPSNPDTFLPYVATSEVDVSDAYKLDPKTTENFYGNSTIVSVKDFTPAAPLKITFLYYEHSDGDVYTVNSYDHLLNFIPTYSNLSLGSCLDFRPKASSLNIYYEDETGGQTDNDDDPTTPTESSQNKTIWAIGGEQGCQLGVGNHLVEQIEQIGPDLGNTWSQISVGYPHGMAIKQDGSLWGWETRTSGGDGAIDYFPLGLPSVTMPECTIFQILQENIDCNLKTADYDPTIQDWNWKMVACGYNTTIAVKTDGTLWSVGLNDVGQLGQGDTTNRIEFTRIGTETNWDKCYMGNKSAAAITKDGDVFTWGENTNCQLGLGHTNTVYAPEQVEFDADPDHNVKIKEVSISVNGLFMTAVSQAGGIYGWGYDEFGTLFPQCGGGSGESGESGITAICTPCRFGKKCDWDNISSGDNFIAAIKTNGTIWTWGGTGENPP